MTTETLMTDGQNTQAADTQQAAAAPTDGTTTPAATDAATTQDAATTDAQTKPEGENTEAPQGAPEKYEFKATDGTAFDDAVIGAYSEVAKELNLSQEAAQKVLDKMAPVMVARQTEQIAKTQQEWTDTAKTDKEFGGSALAENLGVAKKALDTFGTPELKTLLSQSGLGNHPEIIRAFYRAGKAISEDTFVGGRAAPQGGKSLADRLYS